MGGGVGGGKGGEEEEEVRVKVMRTQVHLKSAAVDNYNPTMGPHIKYPRKKHAKFEK